MNNSKTKNKQTTAGMVFYWLPRILSILFVAFISMFALDVFGKPQWFLALLIHLIPSFILCVLTFIAWKYEKIGGALFIILGFSLLVYSHLELFIIVIPIITLGTLFLVRPYFYKS
ncbi:hypothetical protein COV24_00715 [candidate division WWE3 bacterium CG10_big_fil_rev_8_21_14_0_10_32_10]|uniref:DUF7670 domain-containing protein n=1 Tax=candidate division WWE3 bacterium CG10_big_fil_rev_8_21_14_0_10_32_10 TaxID=1975090 RepID=A0A2H0RBH5_UNCKA|nr:MAG: hypothetical protein COV24_00715 [candidate division WWE3 bacterium CG10_big_fil_rev_8_21_14_0_10_32_10]